MSALSLRPASPSDAAAIAPLVYSSGPAAFDYVFSHGTNSSALAFLEQSLREPGGEFGYANHIVAELDGKVAGVAASFSGDSALRYMLVALRQILGNYGPIRGTGVIRRGLQVESVIQPPTGAMHYIAHVGVAAESRRNGIGRKMVEHLLEEGKRLNRATAVLDVASENEPARKLYERLGFSTIEERKSKFANSTATVPHHFRMTLPL